MDANDGELSEAQTARINLTTSTLFSSNDRYEVQECLSYMQNHWMLSVDDFKIPTEPPNGVISQLTAFNSNQCWILIPDEGNFGVLDFKVLHQIIRELTLGIYLLNQTPSISLETNYDCSTSVQLPPAYIDTKVGQLLTNVDYMMKALWHGSFIPREKRHKFSEQWRKKLDVNLETGKAESKTPHIMDFNGAGMIDVTKIKEYQNIYDALPFEHPGDSEALENQRFFMDHVDDLSMQMNVFLKSFRRHENMFLVDGDWLLSSMVKLTDDKLDRIGYERLQSKLRVQKDLIQSNLANKEDIGYQLSLIKLIGFLVPFMCALRRKMKIPDISKLLPPILGDQVKTERELPPLMTGEDYRCKNFSFKNQLFSLHGGILIDLETPDPSAMSSDISENYANIIRSCKKCNEKALDVESSVLQHYEVPTVEVGGRRYYVMRLDLDTYYPQTPKRPQWLQQMVEHIGDLKPKKLPIQEPQMMDVYKKIFGIKKAQKLKTEKIMSDDMNVPMGLKIASQRGLVSIFAELSRKSQMSQLMKQDESGLSLIHHAAVNNRPQIIAKLILQSMDINARRNQSVLSIGSSNYLLNGDGVTAPQQDVEDDSIEESSANDQGLSDEYFRPKLFKKGPTALHLAARCGSLDAAACLCANYANTSVFDQNGWAPVHHAAYYNHIRVIRMLIRRHETLLELATQNEEKNTPMLLASSSGALEAVRCLIGIGAEIQRTNGKGHNFIHLAALRFHTNILEYFIHNKRANVSVWDVLVAMLLHSDVTMQDASVRCLEILSLKRQDYWKDIRDHNGIPALVKLLESPRSDIQNIAASVLCNISEEDDIRIILAECQAPKILIKLLRSPLDDLQSRAAIMVADIACIGDNCTALAELGAIPPLIALLNSELEDVLVNSVNALRVLCDDNTNNQTSVAQEGAIEPLVEFLSAHDSDILQSASCAALAALCHSHRDNQDKLREAGAIEPLVRLLEHRGSTVQTKAAGAVEALALDNTENQEVFIELDAPDPLINKLIKSFDNMMKEQGACALWAIAGHTQPKQKMIAERAGVSAIIGEMIVKESEKLQYVGCMAMTSLCRENMVKQNKCCEHNGIENIVRMIRSTRTSERVLMTAINTLGVLCLGIAHKNNVRTQNEIAEMNAIPVLVGLLQNPPSVEIQVEVACTLGCIVLGNSDNQSKLKKTPSFKYKTLLSLLQSKDRSIRLQAGYALAIFGFNNTPQQYAIREAGGISYSIFKNFLTSENEFYRASASFQIVVLARVIVDKDQVSLTAEGVTELVRLLHSTQHNSVIQSASYLSSLAHTRAGIPDAMVTSGAIEILIQHLSSPYDLVRTSCAVALGYLSFNKTAARKLLMSCRNDPKEYDKLVFNLDSSARISEEFKKDFEIAKKIGLPSQSLETNGGPPVCPGSARPKTGMSHRKEYRGSSAQSTKSRMKLRAVSAPIKSRSHPLY